MDIDNLVRELRTGNYIQRDFGTISQGGVHVYAEDVLWFQSYEPRKWILYFEYDYLDIKREKAFAVLDLVTEWDNIENKWYVHDDIVESEKRQGFAT